MNPEEIITRQAMSTPHRIYAATGRRDEDHVKALSQALGEKLRNKLRDPKAEETVWIRA